MSGVATLGNPRDGVVINESTTTTTTTTTEPHHHHQHHHHHGHHHPAGAAATTPAPTTGAHPTQPGPNNSDGRAVLSNLGGPMAGSVVLGGQCECTRNGGRCEHGAGKCMCRGCTTNATSLNPGINIGVSTQQYTVPAGTTGLGGGVGEAGTGMAGVVNPTNTVGAPVTSAVQNCQCVKNAGVCNCAPGQCDCTNCKAHRQSVQATSASAPLAGSEYVGSKGPHYTSSTTTTSSTAANGGIGPNATNSAMDAPITDNSNVPYDSKKTTY